MPGSPSRSGRPPDCVVLSSGVTPESMAARRSRRDRFGRLSRRQGRAKRAPLGRCRSRSPAQQRSFRCPRFSTNMPAAYRPTPSISAAAASGACLDGPRGGKWILTFKRVGRVRSCLRPVRRGDLAAGPDEVRGSVPLQSGALEAHPHFTGCPIPGSTGSPSCHHHLTRSRMPFLWSRHAGIERA
jgi:hypothetical protein